MARAAAEESSAAAGAMQFGYLHIVSDNLAKKYVQDLSNERRGDVLRGRRKLMAVVEDVLGRFFEGWGP